MQAIIQERKLSIVVFVVLSMLVLSGLTQVVFAKTQDTNKGELHRSAVSKVVSQLKIVAGEDSAIGEDLMEIAKEQDESKDKTAEAVKKVEKRSKIKTFFIGADYKNLGALRSQMVTTDNHLKRLNKAKERATSTVVSDIETQIIALEETKANIEDFISENESRFSLLGWFVKLFN